MLERRARLKRGGGYQVRDEMCLSLEELLRAIKGRWAGLSLQSSRGRMLSALLREATLRSFPKCIKKWVLVQKKACV